ncbi:FG-GAP repeat domain-containing protein [Streptomyces sp. NPDC021012]|uniref:FG-GAP repeat domain-containing protein n=1 Tax=Streptomyces sp. NPDC021012 TaxID=3365107 RepID=UPI00379E348E
MPHARSNRRRLVAAVTTVLAVTLGAGALTVPATAAPSAPAAVTADTAAAPFAFPKDSVLVGAGVKGFLTQTAGSTTRRFAWYGEDTGTGYGARTYLNSTRTNDYLVFEGHYQVTVRDLTTMSVLDVPLDPLTGSPEYVGSAADAVFTTVGPDLRKHTKAGGTVPVAGLPDGATSIEVSPGTPDDALVRFTVGGVKKWGLLDLATDTVDEIHELPAGATIGAVSATHVAYTVGTGVRGEIPALFLLDRATDTVQEVPVVDAPGSLRVDLVGGWVVYGDPGASTAGAPSPLFALTAYNPVTKESVKLLDHLTSAAAAGDGSLHVRGGSLDRGEGMYRITAVGDETPVVTLEATTGEPTELQVTGNDVPALVDLDQNGGKAKFTWNLSRPNAEVNLTLRHTRTGEAEMFNDYTTGRRTTAFTWQGEYNGAYTWELTARPLNGIGPTAKATGSFTVTRTPKPHDFDDNGAPDVLLRDGAGRLWRADTSYGTRLQADPHARIGTGWQIYDRIEATGDLAGSTVGDLVARDTAGVLWLYQGDGRGGLGTRTKIGGGWQVYNELAGGGDLTGDGRADLVATDKAGDLYLYKGTGSATAPFATRKKIGFGWGVYNQLTATGNIAGGPAGDLLARDKAGVLWLYLGKGDGTFAARTKVGAGWNAYSQIVGVGDADRDGRPDVIGFGATGQYLYRGTGDWRAPLLPPQSASLTFGGGPYNSVA